MKFYLKYILQYLPLPNGPLPVPASKMRSQPIVMNPVLNIFDVISSQTPINSLNPMLVYLAFVYNISSS